MKKIIFLCLFIFVGCAKSGGSDPSSVTNNDSWAPSYSKSMSMDKLVSKTRIKSGVVSTAVYVGRAIYKSQNQYYVAMLHFNLYQNSATNGFFSDFYLDYVAQMNSNKDTKQVVFKSKDLGANPAYDATENAFEIFDPTSRYASMVVAFHDNTDFGNLKADAVVSSDFSTMIAGDGVSFLMIAQRLNKIFLPASSHDIVGIWKLANFRHDATAGMIAVSKGIAKIGGKGGSGLTAFSGSDSGGKSQSTPFSGELQLTDATSGTFAFGYDSGIHEPPKSDGLLDGVFLLAPDKRFVVGYDFATNQYLGGSR